MARQSATHPNQRSRQSNERHQGEQEELHGFREGSGAMSRGLRQVDSMVEDHEVQSVLIALAAGFGVGCLIGCALAGDSRRSSNFTDRFAAEGLGRRMMESLERVLPDALSAHFRG